MGKGEGVYLDTLFRFLLSLVFTGKKRTADGTLYRRDRGKDYLQLCFSNNRSDEGIHSTHFL